MARASLAAVLLLLLAACSEPDVTVYTTAKEVEAAPAASTKTGLQWTVPSSWKVLPSGGMRAAAFAAPGPCEVTVVTFPGEAGGDLANVDRWRGQLGLGPLGGESALEKASTRLASKAGPLRVVDLSGGGRRLLGAILASGGRSWFFKLTGPDAAAAAAKPAFLEFLESLRHEG